MRRWLRTLRRVLCGDGIGHVPAHPLEFQTGAFERAQLLVAMFYAANLLLAGYRLVDRARWESYESFDPLWPLVLTAGSKVNVVAANLFTVNAIAAALAAFLPTLHWTRWAAFGGAFLANAFENSFGRIGHGGHAWVWAAFFFAFLPAASKIQFASSRVLRQRYLQIFWSAQFAVLFFYSMSGWLKLVTVPIQLWRGEVCALSPEALSRHVARRLLETQSQPIFGHWVIDYQWLSWPLFVGAIYLEAFAVLIAFRPAWHRLWGAGLVLMHLGIGLCMDIWFVPPMFLLTALFVNSPFHSGGYRWREMLKQLPGVDLIAVLSRKKGASTPQ